MSFKLSDSFTLTKKEKIKENNTIVYFYEHKKTKAKVLYFSNQNESAGFATYFKTLSENSRGTTHILEHSVFEGSRKYNQENSLDYIFNNSLASFANAFTFTDKTMYIFCSSFQKDYLNLLDIYLDFVYFPLLDEKTLRKEGHFFKKNPEGYEFNGIVFNEMKNSLLGFDLNFFHGAKNFFTPGCYSHLNGGDPYEVVDLDIEELRQYHKDKYHPSNSTTILYGKINKNKVFSKLDEVFSQFEFEEKSFEINPIPLPENKTMSLEYQDIDGDNTNKFVKYYLLKGMVNEKDYLGINLVKKYFFDYDFSPLRRVLEDSGFCTTIESEIIDDYKMPIISIICHGVKHEDIEKLEDLIDKSIYKYSKNIPLEIKKLLLKRYEYLLKEIEFSQNQAIDIIISASRFLNYDLDPLIGLRNSKSLKIIENILKGKNFEKFLSEKFLPSQTLSIKFTPNKHLLENYNKKLEKKLNQKLKLWDLNTLDKQISEHEVFLNKEKIEPNYPSLKKLRIQDLDLTIPKFESNFKDNIFTNFLNTSDVVRLKLNFDISDFNFSKLEYLGLYLNLVNQIGTLNHSFDEFAFQRKNYFDLFYLHNQPYLNHKSNKKIYFITLYLKFLKEDSSKVLDILKEYILNIDFSKKERIKFLIEEHYQSLKDSIASDPLPHAQAKALSFMSEFDYIHYNISSLPMLNKLKFIIENFDNEFEALINEFRLIHSYIFNQNCIFNFGISKSNNEFISEFVTQLSEISNIIPSTPDKLGDLKVQGFEIKNKNLNFFLPSNSDTNFNVMAVKYNEIEKKEKSLMRVLDPYMNQYLWDHIRTKNGAYGARFYYNKENNFSEFFSYSDPKINETYNVYLNTKNSYDLSKFKKYSYEKMKLRFLSSYKRIYRNEEVYGLGFSDFIKDIPYETKKSDLDLKKSLNFNDFKNLFKNLRNIQFIVKVVASTKERIKDFSEKYETLS